MATIYVCQCAACPGACTAPHVRVSLFPLADIVVFVGSRMLLWSFSPPRYASIMARGVSLVLACPALMLDDVASMGGR